MILAITAIARTLIPTFETVLNPIVIDELKIRCIEMAAKTKTSAVFSHHVIGNAKAMSASNNPTQASTRDQSDFRKPNKSISAELLYHKFSRLLICHEVSQLYTRANPPRIHFLLLYSKFFE